LLIYSHTHTHTHTTRNWRHPESRRKKALKHQILLMVYVRSVHLQKMSKYLKAKQLEWVILSLKIKEYEPLQVQGRAMFQT
jgi:hypothetical protein